MSIDIKIYIFKKNKRKPVTCIEMDGHNGYECSGKIFKELGVEIDEGYDNETFIPNDIFKKYLKILYERTKLTYMDSYYLDLLEYASDDYEVYYTTW